MSLQARLEPKVEEIERLAQDMYEIHLSAGGLHVGSDGTVDVDPNAVGDFSGELDLAEEQRAYDDFLSSLTTVRARFELYYYLDAIQMGLVAARLGGQEERSPLSGQLPTVHARIQYAYHTWMHPVLGMIDADEWSGGGGGDEQWRGRAAQRFYDLFLLPFVQAAEKQLSATRLLAMVAQSVHDGIRAAEDDLLAIANGSVAALSGDGDHMGPDLSGLSGPLNVASFISSALSLIPSPASPFLGTASLATAGLSSMFASTDDSSDRDEWRIGGGNGPLILESIWDCLMKFEGEVDRKDQQMAAPLTQDLWSTDCLAGSDLELPEPVISGPDAFGEHTSGTTDPSVPLAGTEAVVTPVKLYTAGYRNLPSAAYQYEQATSDMVDPLPETFTQLFFQTSLVFQQARARVRVVISDIRWYLTRAGETLVQVAQDYENTDEESAEVLRQIGALAPPEVGQPVPVGFPV